MIAISIVLSQITIVAIATALACRVALRRDPALAARVGFVGIVVCSSVIPLTYFEIPRLWDFGDFKKWNSENATSVYDQRLIPEETTVGTTVEDNSVSNSASGLQFSPLSLMRRIRDQVDLKDEVSLNLRRLGIAFAVLISGLLLVRIGLGCIGLFWMQRDSRDCVCEHTLAQFRQLTARLRPQREFTLRTTNIIQSPCVSWLRSTTVFVPSNFGDWTQQERLAAMAHELIHLQRRDAKWRAVADFFVSTFGFHPLASVLRRYLVTAQEIATDAQAAMLLENPNDYRTGLSLLALRMDAQPQQRFTLGVSVSTNSLVRRIKMLRKPFVPYGRIRSTVLLATFMAVSLALVSWTAKADDPVRIASRQDLKSSFLPFDREPSEPWKELGTQSGYWSLNVEAVREGVWAQLWTEGAASSLQDVDLNEHGLVYSNVQSVHTDLQMSLKYLEPEERQDPDKKFEGRIASNAFSIRTKQAVNWVKLGDLVLDQSEFPEEVQDFLRNTFEKFGTSNSFELISQQSREVKVELSAELRATFNHVNGGLLTAACVVPTKSLNEVAPHIRPQDDPFEIRALVQQSQVIALGVDHNQSTNRLNIRMALLPHESFSGEELAESVRDKLVVSSQIVKGLEALSPRLSEQSIGQALLNAQVRSEKVEALGRSIVVVDVAYEGDLIQLFGVASEQQSANGASDSSAPLVR